MKIHYSAPMMVIILLILFIMYQQSQVSLFEDSTSSSSQARFSLVKEPLRSNIRAINDPREARQAGRMIDMRHQELLKVKRESSTSSGPMGSSTGSGRK